MALVDCEICERQVSEDAHTCPHCGHPRRGKGIVDSRRRLDHEEKQFNVTGDSAKEAHRDFVRFLLFANSGALLIVFTLAGANIKRVTDKPDLLMMPAFAFAFGLILAGFGVFIRRLTIRDAVRLRHKRLKEIAEGETVPMLLFFPELECKANWIIRLEVLSFVMFLAGVIIGLLKFFNIT